MNASQKFQHPHLEFLHADVLILGTGIAGLSAAVTLAEKGLKIVVVTRESDVSMTNTSWAQGGIIYAQGSEKELIEDIKKASSYTSYDPAVEFVSHHSAKILQEILVEKVGVSFEKNDKGEFEFTKEAAHSCARILYKGDYTGKEIQSAMLRYLRDENRFPNIQFLESYTAIDLLTSIHHGVNISQRYEENKVLGAYVFNQHSQSVLKVMAKFTILATGGVGAIYLHHSNAEGARGDGHAMAKRAGAQIIDMEFIQFHPTTFYQGSSERRFLISEAVRGEGGILVNCHGERFMEKYHPEKELAPRDVVARAIMEEIIFTKHDCVYLDISMKDPEWMKNRFPTIYAYCLKAGIDMTKEAIPVVPAAHYTCGGVKTNLVGETSLKHLYAVGEVACTGLHGANRLASTSLLEGLTFGTMAARSILEKVLHAEEYPHQLIKDWVDGTKDVEEALIHQDLLTLKQSMWNYVGLTRSRDRLVRANAMFKELKDEIDKFYKDARLNDRLIGLRNSVEVAQMILSASLRNQKSVGCFYRKS